MGPRAPVAIMMMAKMMSSRYYVDAVMLMLFVWGEEKMNAWRAKLTSKFTTPEYVVVQCTVFKAITSSCLKKTHIYFFGLLSNMPAHANGIVRLVLFRLSGLVAAVDAIVVGNVCGAVVVAGTTTLDQEA